MSQSRMGAAAAALATAALAIALPIALLAAPRSAFAEDERSDSLTVMPMSGANLAVSSLESRASLEVASMSNLTLFSLRASAPLDSETRTNEFLDKGLMTSGFSASMLVGLDQRAWILKQADERLQRLAEAVEVLRTPPLNMDLRSAFVKKHGLKNHPNAIARHFCEPPGGAADAAAPIDPENPNAGEAQAQAAPCEMTTHVPRGICQALEKPCDDVFDLAAAASEASRAVIGSAACAGFIDGRNIDRCFAASWWLLVREREVNTRKIAVYFREPGSAEKTWETLAAVDAKRAKALLEAGSGKRAATLIENRDEIIGVLREAYRTTALERRDLLAAGLATTKYELYSVLFDASIGYDRFDVVAINSGLPVSTERSRIALGVNYTRYFRSSPGFTLNLRGGFEHSQRSGAVLPDCSVFDPRLPTTCDEDTPVLLESTPEDVSSLYARGAVTYQWRDAPADSNWIPGVELRGGFEDVGQGASVTLRPTLFATVLRGSLSVRVGVAFDMAYKLDESEDELARSQWRVAPMFMLGGTFADLRSLD